jgi:hypothetical protein
MDSRDRWKLADELNVYQIALLIVGRDPGEFEHVYYQNWDTDLQSEAAPYLNAIKNAVRGGRIKAELSRDGGYNGGQAIDWSESVIDIESFRDWLRSRNYSDGFFARNEAGVDGLLDQSGSFYAPKLAAAVRAWTEVTSDPTALNGKTPKKALEIWLRKHAGQYGLTLRDGNPNEQGIEEISKVANWKPTGGAARTPTPLPEATHPPPTLGGKNTREPSPPSPNIRGG